MANELYPAKLIMLRTKDFQRGKVPTAPPGPPSWFFENQKGIIKHLNELVGQIDHFIDVEMPILKKKILSDDSFPFPMVIKMGKLAKSHRPDLLFKEVGSEVIAVHALGKLVAGISEESLEMVRNIIHEMIEVVPKNREEWIYQKKDKSQILRNTILPEWTREYELLHELTSIKEFLPYTSGDVLESMGAGEGGDYIQDGEMKVRFFKFEETQTDSIVFSSFLSEFREVGIRRNKVSKLKYSTKLNTYVVPYINEEIFKQMSEFPGVESISSFLRFQIKSKNLIDPGKNVEIIIPEEGKFYPKVALVDSGISLENQHLSPWVDKRETFVPLNRQDNYHGEFVGGMLIYGHILNPSFNNIVDCGVKILDVVVLPDQSKDSIREDDLLDALEEALEQYASEYRVWNLSLGSTRLCSGIINEFTAAIDEMQDAYNVQFVIAAGNFSALRDSSSIEELQIDDLDRLSLPADSVRAITVGAIAHGHDSSSLVRKGEVVPYSRRGPGIGLSIKPEVVHYSGNPESHPVNSIDSDGDIVSDFGTSFSAPIVSAIVAEYYEQFPHSLSRRLAKALLIHGSTHPISNKRVSQSNDHYFYGFGIPRRIHDILYGDEHEITLMFEGTLNHEENANWIKITDFPFPESLSTNEKVRGEILVTLVYEPHLNPKLGSEYCRSNIDLRLRTLLKGKISTITKGSSAGDIPLTERWEKTQMTRELKWSSAKQIQFISPIGVKGTNDISLDLFPTWREQGEKQPLPFSVIITIRDPKKKCQVYNETSRLLLQSFQTNDISLRYSPTRIVSRN